MRDGGQRRRDEGSDRAQGGAADPVPHGPADRTPDPRSDRTPAADRPTRGEVAAVLLLTVLAGWLRWRLLDQPIRYDEAVTWLSYVSAPIARGLSLYDLPNNHLFHTLLAHVSTDLLGDGPRALRMPAFLAGTALVPATWWLGRAAAGGGAALLGGAAVAVSPVLILFSTNARGYGIMVLAFVVMARLALALRRRGSALDTASFAGAAALAGWTLPAALYPAAAAGAWLLAPAAPGEEVRPLGERVRSLSAAAAGAAATAAFLYGPVLRRSGLESLVANRFVTPRGRLEAAAGLPGYLGEVAAQWAHGVPAALVGLMALGALAAAAGEVRRLTGGGDADGGGPPALFPLALATSAVLLVAHGRVPFARVWLFLLPAFAIFAGRGLDGAAMRLASAADGDGRGNAGRDVGPRVRSAVVAGLVPIVAAGGTLGLLTGTPVRGWGLTGVLPAGDRVARYLAARVEPGDAVKTLLPSDAPLEYYFRRLEVTEVPVNGFPEPGGCVYLVVNRRAGQTPYRVGGFAFDEVDPRRLRRFDGSEVWAVPAPGGPAGAGDCGPGPEGGPRNGRDGGGPDRRRRRGDRDGARPAGPEPDAGAGVGGRVSPSLRATRDAGSP